MRKEIETCFNYCEIGKGFFSSDEQRWITRIHKLKEQYPNEVTIIKEPEDNDGCIYCRLPSSWLKIGPKKKVTMTEEQKQVISSRLHPKD